MEHFQPPLAHQLAPAACKLMKSKHFTSSHLSITSELCPQLLTDICHGPLGRSAPCCTPRLNVHSMFMDPVSRCYSTECPTLLWFHLIQIKYQVSSIGSINWRTSLTMTFQWHQPWLCNKPSKNNYPQMWLTRWPFIHTTKKKKDHLQRLSDHFQLNHGTNCNVHEFSWLTICKT